MTILSNQPVTAEQVHPSWCAARFCQSDSSGTTHSSKPFPTRASGGDVEVRVSMALDDDGRHTVRLDVEDLASLLPGGELIQADAHLTATQAEGLSLALAHYAAQVRLLELAQAVAQ